MKVFAPYTRQGIWCISHNGETRPADDLAGAIAVAAVLLGVGASEALRAVAASLCDLALTVPHESNVAWAREACRRARGVL